VATVKIGDAVVVRGLTTPERVAECLEIQERLKASGKPRSLGSILVERGYVSREDIDRTMLEVGRATLGISPAAAPAPIPVPRPAAPAPVPVPRPAPAPAPVSAPMPAAAPAPISAPRLGSPPARPLDPMQTLPVGPPAARPPAARPLDPMQTLPVGPPAARPAAARPLDPMQTLPVGPPVARPKAAPAPFDPEKTVPAAPPATPKPAEPYDPEKTAPAAKPRPAPKDDQRTRTELPSFAAANDQKTVAQRPAFAGGGDDQRTRTEMSAYEDTASEGRPPADPEATRIEPHRPFDSEATRIEPRKPFDSEATHLEQPPVARGGVIVPERAAPTKRQQLEIPGYVIEQKLGEGAMGAVYRGRRASDGAAVAIKILPPQLAKNAEYVARFTREAESARRLSHPSIVAGLDHGTSGGFHFFVMEFVDGETLEKLIQRHGAVPEPEAIRHAIAVASALECAAKEGIVHRDLKPANILVSKDGLVKVVDLGLAKQTGAGGGGPQLTRVGMIMGSPYYLSPEQASLKPLDTRTDLYGLGATFFHVVTGQVPFDGADPIEIMEQVLNSAPPDARVRNPKVSVELSQVLKKLMAKRPDDRYATPTELRKALEHLRDTGRLPGAGGLWGWLKGLFGKG